MKKLGFGMMRLPTVDPKATEQIDLPQVCGMVDTFLARGYTYFDTAYFYHGGKSECAVRDALVKRHSRESFLLADKLPLMHLKDADSGEAQARIFHEQLEKCGVDYFDYYLLHCITQESYETAQRLETFAFLRQMQAEGKLRHLGFSFHDKAGVLEQVLSEHPEVEFVQLQLNYLDWEDERVQSRKCYETVLRHGKQVIVMEPVKGGKLAALPEEAAALLRGAHPDWTPAQWALRFAAGLDQVMMVLSGRWRRTPSPWPRRSPCAGRTGRCWSGRRKSSAPSRPSPAPPAATAWTAAPGRSQSRTFSPSTTAIRLPCARAGSPTGTATRA